MARAGQRHRSGNVALSQIESSTSVEGRKRAAQRRAQARRAKAEIEALREE
jgi:hypothetical protein